MEFMLRVSVAGWFVALHAKERSGWQMFVTARGNLVVDRAKPLYVPGQAEPLACAVDIQLMRPDDGVGPVGMLVRPMPQQVSGAVYHAALFDEVVHRHRSGGSLPTELLLGLDLPAQGNGVVWNDGAPGIEVRWVSMSVTTSTAARG